MSFAALAEQGRQMAQQYGYRPRPAKPASIVPRKVPVPQVKKYADERVAILDYITSNGTGQKLELMLATGLEHQGYRATMDSLRSSGAVKSVKVGNQSHWVLR